jgi:hypothetical protein
MGLPPQVTVIVFDNFIICQSVSSVLHRLPVTPPIIGTKF